MEPYAVVETGGKQYRVQKGDVLDIELLEDLPEAGSQVTLDRVLAVSNGSSLTVGTPVVEGAGVQAEVIDQHRGPKVVAYKKRRRKGYERKVGHRQELVRVKIASISGN